MRAFRHRWAWTAGALLLFVEACSVGPRYHPPPAQVPPAYKEQPPAGNDQWKTAHPSDGVLRGDWWEMFKAPRLTDLEGKVVVSNQNVRLAEAQFRQARALVKFTHSGYFPSVTTTPSIDVTRQSASLTSRQLLNTGGVNTTYGLPLGASWEPNLWGRVGLHQNRRNVGPGT